jgi:hypothetical protein
VTHPTLHNLATRLDRFPKHRETDCLPVVATIDGLPIIIGNARSPLGAKFLAQAFSPEAKCVSRTLIYAGPNRHIFFWVL